jgi:hypothetical protein
VITDKRGFRAAGFLRADSHVEDRTPGSGDCPTTSIVLRFEQLDRSDRFARVRLHLQPASAAGLRPRIFCTINPVCHALASSFRTPKLAGAPGSPTESIPFEWVVRIVCSCFFIAHPGHRSSWRHSPSSTPCSALERKIEKCMKPS